MKICEVKAVKNILEKNKNSFNNFNKMYEVIKKEHIIDFMNVGIQNEIDEETWEDVQWARTIIFNK